MTVLDMAKVIGKPGLFHVDKGFKVQVIVQDVRQVFGRIDYCIRPVDGIGNLWIDSNRVTVEGTI